MLVRSGIAGFDGLLHGGLYRNSSILVTGAPGTGKTTFGLEFIYKGITEMHEPGIIITFEEFPEQIYRDAANYGWDLPALERQGLLRTVCTSPEVLLDRSSGLLDDLVGEIGARRLLLDSVTHLGMVTSEESELRHSIYGICGGLKRLGLTSILIHEVADHTNTQVSFVEYVVDTVIHLYFIESLGSRKRYLEIMKSRGQDFITGKHAFKFDWNGINIHHIEPIDLPSQESPVPLEKVSSGVPGLDDILSGGFLRGTSILIEGDSGTGKTVMGLQYLLEGIRRQERGLILSTEEDAVFLQHYASTFQCQELCEALDKGDIRVVDLRFTPTSVEEVLSDLIDTVKRNSIKRLVIDSINSFSELVDNPLILKGHLRNLFRCLSLIGCTTLVILGEDTGESETVLKSLIRPLVHGDICLSSVVEKGKRKWLLEVTKMKGGNFVSGIHRAEISNRGMAVYRRLGRR